jgi:pimeloyl-ACP methyl ester carboxylesterase
MQASIHHIPAGQLDVAYEQHGPSHGEPVVLLHGFPYDVHAYDEVAPALAHAGCRIIVPYLRGYGPTRFLEAATPRSGQQGVLALDLLALLDALHIESALLGGYDWGGRAACIVAALWPARVRGLITCGGYNIQDIAHAARPQAPEDEYRYWYQYYFHGERGRVGLAENRRALCKLLWRLWSPTWSFSDATFERSAAAFDNPDFVDVVVHSYRHRFGLVPGDPVADDVERRLAALPPIGVPTIALHGGDDGVSPSYARDGEGTHFCANFASRVVPGTGHNLPQEQPQVFTATLLELR